jgi:hypothetical protein
VILEPPPALKGEVLIEGKIPARILSAAGRGLYWVRTQIGERVKLPGVLLQPRGDEA